MRRACDGSLLLGNSGGPFSSEAMSRLEEKARYADVLLNHREWNYEKSPGLSETPAWIVQDTED